MKYYLISQGTRDTKKAFKIVKVLEVDAAAFLKRNLDQVICEGDNMKELLFQFGKKLDSGGRFEDLG